MELNEATLDKPQVAFDTAPVEATSLGKQFFRWRTLAAFAASFVIMYLVFSRLNVNPGDTWQTISNADPWRIAIGVAIYFSAFPIRGLRWRIILKNAGFGQNGSKEVPSSWVLARFMAMGWFANCILPAKLGDAYRAFLTKRKMEASFSKTIGTVLAERVIDIIMVFGVLLVAAALVARDAQVENLQFIILLGVTLVTVMIIGMVIMARFGGFFVERILPKRFHALYEMFHEGTFGSFRSLPAIAGLSVFIWLAEAARVYFVAWSLGVSLQPALAVVAALTDALLVGIPLTPGGLGAVEAGLTAVLTVATSNEKAFSIAILDRGISYWGILALGGLLHFWGVNPYRALRARLHRGN